MYYSRPQKPVYDTKINPHTNLISINKHGLTGAENTVTFNISHSKEKKLKLKDLYTTISFSLEARLH